MKPLPIISLAAIILATAAWNSQAADEPKGHDGTWLPTSAQMGDFKFDDKTLKGMKLVIEGNKYTVTLGDSVDKGTTKVDATAKPKTMDIMGTEGPNKDKTFLAIFEDDGDTMRVCYDLTGKKRPTEFKTSKEMPYFLVTWKREKK